MIRVWQSRPPSVPESWADWDAVCESHGHIATSPDWTWAMENAWGHLAMHHGSRP